MSELLHATHDPGTEGHESRWLWILCAAVMVIGLVAALLALWRPTHTVETVLGALCLPAAAFAQMFSQQTNQRWMAIIGAVGGGFAIALGIAHGGV